MNIKTDERGVLSPVILLLIVVVVGVAGFAAWRVSSAATKDDKKTSSAASTAPASGYETAIGKFIAAIQAKDKVAADGLQSPAFQASNKASGGTTSFYDVCQSGGELCTGSFSAKFLAKGTKTTEAYTAADGTKGHQMVYTIKSSSSGENSSSSSATTLKLAAVPSGNSWLIDLVDLGGKASGNASGSIEVH